MTKNTIHRGLNLSLYFVLCFMIGTGLMLWFRLPPGRLGGHGLSVLGLTRHEWGDFHLYAGLIFLLLCVLHLAMNWTWMRKIAGGRKHWPLYAGLGVGLVIIVTGLLLPVTHL